MSIIVPLSLSPIRRAHLDRPGRPRRCHLGGKSQLSPGWFQNSDARQWRPNRHGSKRQGKCYYRQTDRQTHRQTDIYNWVGMLKRGPRGGGGELLQVHWNPTLLQKNDFFASAGVNARFHTALWQLMYMLYPKKLTDKFFHAFHFWNRSCLSRITSTTRLLRPFPETGWSSWAPLP